MVTECGLPSATSVVVGYVARLSGNDSIDSVFCSRKGDVLSRWWSEGYGADVDLVVRRVGVGGIQVDGQGLGMETRRSDSRRQLRFQSDPE